MGHESEVELVVKFEAKLKGNKKLNNDSIKKIIRGWYNNKKDYNMAVLSHNIVVNKTPSKKNDRVRTINLYKKLIIQEFDKYDIKNVPSNKLHTHKDGLFYSLRFSTFHGGNIYGTLNFNKISHIVIEIYDNKITCDPRRYGCTSKEFCLSNPNVIEDLVKFIYEEYIRLLSIKD